MHPQSHNISALAEKIDAIPMPKPIVSYILDPRIAEVEAAFKTLHLLKMGARLIAATSETTADLCDILKTMAPGIDQAERVLGSQHEAIVIMRQMMSLAKAGSKKKWQFWK